mgnify:CR=1 FL=1
MLQFAMNPTGSRGVLFFFSQLTNASSLDKGGRMVLNSAERLRWFSPKFHDPVSELIISNFFIWTWYKFVLANKNECILVYQKQKQGNWYHCSSFWCLLSGSAFFDLYFWTCQFAAGADWAGQSTKWFVMPVTNELTNRFGVGSVDFHWNLASSRVLEMSREQSRCDNNFSLSRSKLAAQYFNHGALSVGQLLFYSHGNAGSGSRPASTGQRWWLQTACATMWCLLPWMDRCHHSFHRISLAESTLGLISDDRNNGSGFQAQQYLSAIQSLYGSTWTAGNVLRNGRQACLSRRFSRKSAEGNCHVSRAGKCSAWYFQESTDQAHCWGLWPYLRQHDSYSLACRVDRWLYTRTTIIERIIFVV